MKTIQNIGQETLKEILKGRREAFLKKNKGKKVDYPFQEIGLELEEWFGQKCWFVFYKPEADLDKVKNALEICKTKEIKNIGYLLGILKNYN